jgi:YidC/Oxa1 family membrane protein insertase
MPKKFTFRPEYNALLAFALSLIVLAVFSHYAKAPVPPPNPATHQASQGMAGQTSASLPVAQSAATAVAPAPVEAIQGTSEKSITIESPLYHVELSNHGATARSWQLSRYSDDKKPPRPLDLVNADSAQQVGAWPLSLLLQDAALQEKANSAVYKIIPDSGTVTAPITAPVDVQMQWSDGHLAVQKTLKFGADYLVDLSVSVTLDGKPIPVGVAWRGGFGDPNVYKASQLVTVFYDTGNKLNLLTYKKLGVTNQQQTPAQQPGAMAYAGVEDQFFAAAFLADSGTGMALWHWLEQHNVKGDGGATSEEPVEEIAAGTVIPVPFHCRMYVGPKDITILGHLNPSLEGLVNFGYISIIAKPLLEVLKWIHGFIPNYGWAIIFLTLVINMALFPLKIKSWRSMQKMQRLKPQVDSLQAKYKKYASNDPRKKKLNEEMMELYKREGVNPVGGCLPMLLQFPVWAALYRTLGGAIELRHAPWIWWVRDLSAYDHYFILPIAMMGTMYLTQKMTPTAAAVDPVQQKMLGLMPLVFGALFFHSSSGLVLYILTSNIVAIGQQYFLNKTESLPAPGSNNRKR